MNRLISVIVPIYNVEDYLPKCINSIINQTYTNLEIILVDDGSSDNCPAICDEYQKKDNRIKVIHKSNGGLSSARNAGLDIATGDLIAFVDSDDYIEPTMLEELYKNMKKYDSDISICNFYYVRNNKKIIALKDKKNSFYLEGKDKFKKIRCEYDSCPAYAWNKLYKRKIFDKIRYPEGKIYEDIYVICDILDRANRISYTLKPLYNYIYRKDSIVNTFTISQFDKMNSMNKKIDFFDKNNYVDLVIEEKKVKSCEIIRNLARMNLYNVDNKEIYNKYYQELLSTSKELKWRNSSRKIIFFKIFKNKYILWNSFERKIYYSIKSILNKG